VGPTDGVVLQHWNEALRHGVSVAVTTRHGGLSPDPYDSLNLGLHVGDDPANVVANRERAAIAFGVDLDTTVFAQQVHGTNCTFVDSRHRGRGARAQHDAIDATDVLVTTTSDVVLVILVADCVPVLLVDPEAKVMAAAHAGWRGTAGGVVASALAAMAQRGARPARTIAYMGPAVAPNRYQVGAEVLHALTEAVRPGPLNPEVADPDDATHWHIDLIAANRQQLRLAGLSPGHLFDSGTSTSDGDYFSDRGDRPCGRFALMARLLP
jgi:YfiH family protein